MITYVDTSTLLKLVIDEDGSDRASTIWTSADTVASVVLIVVEARAALAAAKRGRRLTAEQHADAKRELDALLADLHIVEATEELIAEAAELAEVEALRGDDAVHLAAALLVGATILSSADTELCTAAQRRGLHVANPLVAS
jgi:predicted nucleic acid-binding protein